MSIEWAVSATSHLTIQVKRMTIIDGVTTAIERFSYNPLIGCEDAIAPVKELAAEYFTPEVTAEYLTHMSQLTQIQMGSQLRDYTPELELAKVNVINNN